MTAQNRDLILTNSMTGKRERFAPANPDKVLFYSCGPTVYGALHIGNARALLFADLLYRVLKHNYGEKGVSFVRNYTDVDDKIIVRAHEEKISPFEVAEKYIDYCERDMEILGLEKPSKTVRVTESMDDIVRLIERIIQRGHAYVVEGEVLFSIESFPGYGKLSGKKVDELQAGARVEVDAKKRSPMDFSLWKPHKPGEPYWESPWGRGRPGWHIECSAMVCRWLGETIDLHHGGQDLIFPHHENEIAQTEAATGKPFCGHWVHHAFLTAGNEKMSKSLGNILTIREFTGKYGPELLKYIYLSFHYRSGVPYTEEMLSQALGELERIYLAKKWANDAVKAPVVTGAKGGPAWRDLAKEAEAVYAKIEEELLADLNTPGALGHLFSFVRDLNRVEAQSAERQGLPAASSPERSAAAQRFLQLLEGRLHPLMNVFGEDPSTMLERIEGIRRSRQVGALGDDEIRALIDERNQARRDKNFKRADEIRRQLDVQGIVLVDSPSGTTWKAKG